MGSSCLTSNPSFDFSAWHAEVDNIRLQNPMKFLLRDDDMIMPQYAIQRVCETACPDKLVIDIVFDGGVVMHHRELPTPCIQNLPVERMVLNN
eukprot:jgi/Chlat1/2823/Chrsp187S02969